MKKGRRNELNNGGAQASEQEKQSAANQSASRNTNQSASRNANQSASRNTNQSASRNGSQSASCTAYKSENQSAFRTAFRKSIPIMCSYLFVSMAYGLMMNQAGLRWYYALFASLTIYTGAFQFVLITFLSSGASLLTIGLTAFLMNSRQTFYSLTFLEEFKQMGRRTPYMIQTMTDETYAVNCTLDPDDPNRKDTMFWLALLSRVYWMTGAVAGGVLGQVIPFDLTGIDFCMTALFITILMDQWEKQREQHESHLPPVTGAIVGIACLLIFGKQRFILPALLLVSGILLAAERMGKAKKAGTPGRAGGNKAPAGTGDTKEAKE